MTEELLDVLEDIAQSLAILSGRTNKTNELLDALEEVLR